MTAIRTGVLCLSLAAACAAATITGTIFDPSAAVVPNAAVALVSKDGAAIQKITSGPRGDFIFTGVEPGRYRVEVAVPGFQLARRSVDASDAVAASRADVILKMGGIEERVTVSRPANGAPAMEAARPVRVGGNVQPPRILRGLRPAYPASTRAAGRVLLTGVVRMEGTVAGIRVLMAPDDELAAAATKAVAEMRYEPALLNGQPVETAIEIAIDFEQK